MLPVIAVGAIYLDTFLTVPHYPVEDGKLRASSLTRRRGGNCANTFEVLQQLVDLGGHTSDEPGVPPLRLVSVLPNKASDAVTLMANSLHGVNLDYCVHRPEAQEAASSFIIKSEATGSRTIVSYNGLPEITVEEFIEKTNQMSENVEETRGWFHFEGRNPGVIFDCIREIRSNPKRNGFKVSVEVEKPGRPGLKEMATEADVVFYSRTWAEAEGYVNAEQCLRGELAATREGALLCCTWGEDGATAVQKSSKSDPMWAAVAAWKPKISQPVIDTTGAGDTFIAGMLFALARDIWSLPERLAFANELAGRKVRQEGFVGLAGAVSAYFAS